MILASQHLRHANELCHLQQQIDAMLNAHEGEIDSEVVRAIELARLHLGDARRSCMRNATQGGSPKVSPAEISAIFAKRAQRTDNCPECGEMPIHTCICPLGDGFCRNGHNFYHCHRCGVTLGGECPAHHDSYASSNLCAECRG